MLCKHIQDLDLLGLILKILWINWSRYIFIPSMENRCAIINVICVVGRELISIRLTSFYHPILQLVEFDQLV